jgi:hypothetical protein
VGVHAGTPVVRTKRVLSGWFRGSAWCALSSRRRLSSFATVSVKVLALALPRGLEPPKATVVTPALSVSGSSDRPEGQIAL